MLGVLMFFGGLFFSIISFFENDFGPGIGFLLMAFMGYVLIEGNRY